MHVVIKIIAWRVLPALCYYSAGTAVEFDCCYFVANRLKEWMIKFFFSSRGDVHAAFLLLMFLVSPREWMCSLVPPAVVRMGSVAVLYMSRSSAAVDTALRTSRRTSADVGATWRIRHPSVSHAAVRLVEAPRAGDRRIFRFGCQPWTAYRRRVVSSSRAAVGPSVLIAWIRATSSRNRGECVARGAQEVYYGLPSLSVGRRHSGLNVYIILVQVGHSVYSDAVCVRLFFAVNQSMRIWRGRFAGGQLYRSAQWRVREMHCQCRRRR
jgi:hypothetical protein